jgi:hypothetical protein
MPYFKSLAEQVLKVFLTTLAALAAADRPFDVLTFAWDDALTVSGSAAVLALLVGLAAKGTGDPDSANLTR